MTMRRVLMMLALCCVAGCGAEVLEGEWRANVIETMVDDATRPDVARATYALSLNADGTLEHTLAVTLKDTARNGASCTLTRHSTGARWSATSSRQDGSAGTLVLSGSQSIAEQVTGCAEARLNRPMSTSMSDARGETPYTLSNMTLALDVSTGAERVIITFTRPLPR